MNEGVPSQPSIIRCADLQKDFVTAAGVLPVLRGINLDVPRGASVAITGESGSGKSTLLSLIAGLDTPSGGELFVDGIHPATASESELADFRARKIGIVFQHFHLMKSLTAIENVQLPLDLRKDPDASARASEALSAVGLAERRDHFPAQLSGGECQRVALARAFVPRPSILLADEPTGNLDQRTGTDIIELMFDLANQEGTTLVLVTHSRSLAARCGQTIVLRDGVVEPTAPVC